MYGFGRDIDDVLALKGPNRGGEAVSRAILYSAIGQTILVIGTVLSKTSLALFLLRLVSTRGHKVAIWTPDFFLATAVAAALVVFWLSCRPAAYLWDRRLEGECAIDPGPVAVYAGGWSVALDFWYAGFPWYLVRRLNMSRRDKVVISASMSLGVIAGGCGVKRAMELGRLGSPNYLGDVVGVIVWHAAELCTTLVCIGIPVCRPLYKGWVAGWSEASGWTGTRNRENGSSEEDGGGGGAFAVHTIGGGKLDGCDVVRGSRHQQRRDQRGGGGGSSSDGRQGRGRRSHAGGSGGGDCGQGHGHGHGHGQDQREVTIERAPTPNGASEETETILGLGGGGGRSSSRHTSASSSILVKTEFRLESHRPWG